MDKRIFVEKKEDFQIKNNALKKELQNNLGLNSLSELKILQVYDIFNLSKDLFTTAIKHIFSEPVTDEVLSHEDVTRYLENYRYFAIESLPGQFDQRASSSKEALLLLGASSDSHVNTAQVYLVNKNIFDSEFDEIKNYLLNPVDSRFKDLSAKLIPQTFSCSEIKIPILKEFSSYTASNFEQ